MNLIERLGGWGKAVEALEFLKTNKTHGISEEHIKHLEKCINRAKELELLYFDSDLHLEAAREEINRLKSLNKCEESNMLIKVEIELEVPEGAEHLLQHKHTGELVWFKDDFNLMTSETECECEWDDSNFDSDIVDKLEWMKSEYGSVVLWRKTGE